MIFNLVLLVTTQLIPLDVCKKLAGEEPTQCEVALVERLVPATTRMIQLEADNEALTQKLKAIEDSCKQAVVITNDPLLPVWLQVGLGFAVGTGLGIGVGYLIH